jgi:hypothetical protein
MNESQQITYEITATVRPDLCSEYESYMIEQHIPDLLETGAFESTIFSHSSEGRYRIRYEARNREALDRYLAEHALRLRQHFADTFPEGVELSREEWEHIRSRSS